ncbi:DUF4097 family beta strand repeat-containing protein [Spirillospora sp. NPDC048911]|uniref:DUF4097 family beta strand repeat-containing protein n=1 Tax=Spirillospora sp. NPDC048911 TaxID=3364527 RepID=UPI00371DFE5F
MTGSRTAEGGGMGAAPPERPRRRSVWIVLAALTAMVVVVPTGVTTLGEVLERTASATEIVPGAITAVEVDAGAASVAVGAGATGRTRLHSTLRWSVRRPQVIKSVQARVLKILVVCGEDETPFAGFGCEAELDLQVPPAVSLRVQTTSGQVDVRDIAGDVRIQGSSGEVRLANLRGRIWAGANSGTIAGKGLLSPEVDAGVRSGSIDLAFADPPAKVSVRTGSGGAVVTVPRGSHYRVDGETRSGGREIDGALKDDAATGQISATTGSGSVRIGYPEGR